jgi:outer membrane lipoprotein SlyB
MITMKVTGSDQIKPLVGVVTRSVDRVGQPADAKAVVEAVKGAVVEAVVGAVTGAVTGAVVGAVTGAVVGAVTGAVVGAVTGRRNRGVIPCTGYG